MNVYVQIVDLFLALLGIALVRSLSPRFNTQPALAVVKVIAHSRFFIVALVIVVAAVGTMPALAQDGSAPILSDARLDLAGYANMGNAGERTVFRTLVPGILDGIVLEVTPKGEAPSTYNLTGTVENMGVWMLYSVSAPLDNPSPSIRSATPILGPGTLVRLLAPDDSVMDQFMVSEVPPTPPTPQECVASTGTINPVDLNPGDEWLYDGNLLVCAVNGTMQTRSRALEIAQQIADDFNDAEARRIAALPQEIGEVAQDFTGVNTRTFGNPGEITFAEEVCATVTTQLNVYQNGRVAMVLTPGTQLEWVGFAEDGRWIMMINNQPALIGESEASNTYLSPIECLAAS